MTDHSNSSAENGSNGIFMKIVVGVVSGGLLFCFTALYNQGGDLQAVKATAALQQAQITDVRALQQAQITDVRNLIEKFREENRSDHKDLLDKILSSLDIQGSKKLRTDQ